MKIFKYFLPWLMAAVLVVGSCMTVLADYDDYTEEQLIELRNETKAMFNEYFETNGLNPKYKVYFSYVTYDSYGGYFSSILLYSDEPILISDDNKYLLGSIKELQFNYKNNFLNASSTIVSKYTWSPASVGTLDIFVTNFDLFYEDGETLYQAEDTTGFFPRVPVLQKTLQGTELTGVTTEILTMVPLLIPLLAGYLGLRKALSLVSRTLRTA